MASVTRWDHDPFFFLGEQRSWGPSTSPPTAIGLTAWRAPGLAGQLRVRFEPDLTDPPNSRAYLLLTFQAVSATDEAALLDLTARLPGAEMPLRAHYPTAAEWQAACDAHAQLWNAWRTAYPAHPLEEYRAACAHAAQLRRTLEAGRRELTLAVGLVNRSERLPACIVKGLRACEVWRFTPGHPAPLDDWLAKSSAKHASLVRQGKHPEAAQVEAVRQWVQTRIAQWPAELKARRQA